MPEVKITSKGSTFYIRDINGVFNIFCPTFETYFSKLKTEFINEIKSIQTPITPAQEKILTCFKNIQEIIDSTTTDELTDDDITHMIRLEHKIIKETLMKLGFDESSSVFKSYVQLMNLIFNSIQNIEAVLNESECFAAVKQITSQFNKVIHNATLSPMNTTTQVHLPTPNNTYIELNELFHTLTKCVMKVSHEINILKILENMQHLLNCMDGLKTTTETEIKSVIVDSIKTTVVELNSSITLVMSSDSTNKTAIIELVSAAQRLNTYVKDLN
jgi:hypothetical protein